METLLNLWEQLYENNYKNNISDFISYLDEVKSEHFSNNKTITKDWYKDAIIYSTYADLFNNGIQGLTEKLDYIKDLGINCIWLLPILDSPMKDAGFDISDYKTIRTDLLQLDEHASEEEKEAVFTSFISEAHKRDIKVIFDIAMNHCSVEHKWFKEAKKSLDSKYRDYFIWSDSTELYKEARIIFKGLCSSNWELDKTTNQYYFHRFFEIQPDLNYKNPEVLLAMTDVLVHWKIKGVDGFRADAVPYIWKEEGTNCENLRKTHTVVKFFRAVLDYLSPGSLLLAEACQQPKEVVEYFGQDDECNAAYHFPVMPRIFKALAEEKKDSIEKVLDSSFTPDIPNSSQWLMFLRCHDELTLEMVTPEERKFIFDHYAKDPSWDFRQGEGIAARLAELFGFNKDKIMLANSIMFTLLGTPIVYYGDEFGKGNDVDFYNKVYEETGYADTRYLGRGTIDWKEVDEILADETTLGYQLYHNLKAMISVRLEHPAFGRGSLEFVDIKDSKGSLNSHILAYTRTFKKDSVTVIQNLSSAEQLIVLPSISDIKPHKDLLDQTIRYSDNKVLLQANQYLWL